MRDLKTKKWDRKLLVSFIVMVIISYTFLRRFPIYRRAEIGIIYYAFVILVIAYIIYFIYLFIKRMINKEKKTKEIRQRLACLKPVIKAKNSLTKELFNYLFRLENRFDFVKQNSSEFDTSSIKTTLSAVEKIIEIQKANEDNVQTKNAVEVFGHQKFAQLKMSIDIMNDTIHKFMNGGGDKSPLKDDEINMIKRIADSWDTERFNYDNPHGTAEMLKKYLHALNTAVDNIYEIREY